MASHFRRHETRLSIAGRWVDEVYTPSSATTSVGSSSTSPPVRESGDELYVSLAAATIAQLYFDGVLPVDRTQRFAVRLGYRVVGECVLERLQYEYPGDRLGLRLRIVDRADTAEQPEGPIEVAIHAADSYGAACVVLATGERLRISCSGVKNLVPGDVVRLHVRKSWKQGKTRCVSGDLDEPRLDVRALQLAPLTLFPTGPWTRPEGRHRSLYGERRPPDPVVARSGYLLEDLLPHLPGGQEALVSAVERQAAGEHKAAQALLVGLLRLDLRCLAAHVQLARFAFARDVRRAARSYRIAVGIGEQALGPSFEGVLPWAHRENRPLLLAYFGLGMIEWRLGLLAEAAVTFKALLSIDPEDEQEAERCLASVREWRPWEASSVDL